MNRILLLLLLVTIAGFGQQQNVTFSVSPETFEEDDEITITVSNINVTNWGVNDIYLWSWSFDENDLNAQDSPTNGSWGSSNEAQKFTNNGNGTFSFTFTPNTLYNRTGIGSFGILVKAKNGDGDKKSQDKIFQVGSIAPPPIVTLQPVPNGMQNGLNINPTDNTKATLVFYAPNKTFINLIGNFNNWQRDDTNYLLKRAPNENRFWIELTGLNPQENYMYQYLVDGEIRVADPYSTLISDESNDQYIDEITYPNLPDYPTGKTAHAVTVFKTGEASYNWQVTNFTKPKKTDLVIYELLIRDFDALHSFDAVKARLDYLQNLGINAIEFMPVNEFDGNESWGYNPSFHMALDKYYGTKNAFKSLIDECHKRGIAVILDVVYNHASGQNPYYRMYNTSNGGYGGQPTATSPFFNETATHSYSVFNDFNHDKDDVKDYVKRTAEYWIEEFKIDGFRWDLTKGFTQLCSANNEGCTNTSKVDRINILKTYADYQWAIDPNFYVIFEHLGENSEETEWANYRINEGKGIMLWSNQNPAYNEGTMGYNNNNKSDFSWIDYRNRGWSWPANISYMESHDEERLMYRNQQFGAVNGLYSTKTTNTALERMELASAFYFTIPGPKMIWQFGELGYDISINQNGRTGNKPILWNYFEDANRKAVYNTYSKLIQLKLNYDIFETTNFTLDVANANGLKKIHLTDPNASDLQFVTIIGNFGTTIQSIAPNFQLTGVWYNLLEDNATITVSNTNASITLAPGEFKVYGNKAVTLSTENVQLNNPLQLYPNPTSNYFSVSIPVTEVAIFDLSGKKIKSYSKKDTAHKQYDISELSKGLYIVKLKQRNKFISKKLVVN